MTINCLPSDQYTRQGFRANLAKQIDDVDEETLKTVVHEFPARLEKCLNANGGRFEMNTSTD